MPSKSSATVLEAALANFRGELTVADASTKSGLPLREAEEGLRVLASEFSGHLAATEKGELIYSFPQGLVRPPETRLLRRVGRAIVKAASGMVRLVVRAWVSVVLVGYALIFLAVLIALALRSSDDRDSPWEGVGILLRVIAEALFWTFHPFSPVAMTGEPRWMHVSPVSHRRIPFYERVNRFVFGPTPAKTDPLLQERDVLAEIRRQKGRIAPADVMRVTGLAREDAERLLLRLVVDYQGDISVSEEGAIIYTFADLRATTGRASQSTAPEPVWNRQVEVPPLTGNDAGSNFLFAAINGFNLLASGFVLANDLTLERLAALVTNMASREPGLAALPLPGADGIPLVLGAIPFAFSLALFALPLLRLIRRSTQVEGVARQNGWRAMLRQVLGGAPRSFDYTKEELGRAWEAATGRRPTDAELEDATRDLGGTVDLRDDGTLVYRFEIVAREMEELLARRAAATDEEATAGAVVFSSADRGTGIRERAEKRRTAERGETEPAAREQPENPSPAAPRQIEGKRESLEFLEKLMAEAEQRRRQ